MTLRVEDVVPPTVGVTGFGSNTNIRPSGAPELLRLTGEKNTPKDWIVMIEVATAPGGIDRKEGEGEMAKSATPATIVTSRFVV